MSKKYTADIVTIGGLDVTSTNVSNWNTAYSWGNPSGVYLPLTGGTLTGPLLISQTGSTITIDPHTSGVDIHSTGNIAPHYQTNFTLYTGAIGSGTQRFSVDSSGNAVATSSHRAPIFYDNNNTGYYVDPTSTTWSSYNLGGARFRNIQISSSDFTDTIQNVTTGGNLWLQYGHNGPIGLGYGGGLTTVYNGLTVNSGLSRLNGGIRLPDTNSTIDSMWGIYGWDTQLQFTKRNISTDAYEGTAMFIDYGGLYVQSDYSFRAPIFYDSNNTGYYVDPASKSNFSQIAIQGTSYYFDRNTSYFRWQSPSGYIDIGSGNTTWAHFYTDRPGFYFGPSNVAFDGNIFGYGGGETASFATYYDSNNTAYYVDPHSTSYLNEISGPYFKHISVPSSRLGASYDERVILLIPKVETNDSYENRIHGKLIMGKTGGNVIDFFDIEIQSVYNDTTASFTSSGQRTGHKFVTCTYNGIKWVAIQFAYTANPYNYAYFTGHASTNFPSASPDMLRVISYYNTNGGGVLNTEIYNSITDYNPNPLYKKISNGNGGLTIEGPTYSDIFYDRQNTSYYVDPASTGTALNINGGISTPTMWVNQSTSNYNDYNENIRLFPAGNSVSVIAFGASGTGGTPWNSVLGYSDRFEIRQGGQWQQRNYANYVEAYGSFRAPIFYDSNNTGYYVDPASTSNLNVVGAANRIYTGYNPGDVNSISCSNWFRSSGSTGWYNGSYGGGIYMQDSTWVRVYNGKKFYVDGTASDQIMTNGSVKASVFYDYNNTAYFCSPDTSTSLISLSVNESSRGINIWQSQYSYSGDAYYESVLESFGTWSLYGDTRYNGISIKSKSYDWTTGSVVTFRALQVDSMGQTYLSTGPNQTLYIGKNDIDTYIGGQSSGSDYVAITPKYGIDIIPSGGGGAQGSGYYTDYYFNANGISHYAGAPYFEWTNTEDWSSIANWTKQTPYYRFDFTGYLYSYAYNSLSDENSKENVVPIQNAIDIVSGLQGVSYDWKETGENAYGFIAQQVEAIVPQAVDIDTDGVYSLNYNQFIAIHNEAIKELKAEIDYLKQELNSLKNV